MLAGGGLEIPRFVDVDAVEAVLGNHFGKAIEMGFDRRRQPLGKQEQPGLAAAVGLILAGRPAVKIFAILTLDVGLGGPVGMARIGDDFVIAQDEGVGNVLVDQRPPMIRVAGHDVRAEPWLSAANCVCSPSCSPIHSSFFRA